MTQRWLSGVACLALAATGCGGGGKPGPSAAECDAVLTHLLVLEGAKDGSDGPMCKYHTRCDGSQEQRFRDQCPHVLARTESSCYLRATSLAEIDACLLRSELDDRIQRGKRGPSMDEAAAPAWIGEGGGTLGDKILRKVTAHARQVCACRDAGCAAHARDRFAAWARTIDEHDPEIEALESDIELAADKLYECVRDIERYDPPDAADPLAARDAGYVDPYAYQPDAGLGPYTGIWECDTYRDALERLLACRSLPSYVGSSMASAYRDLKATWGDPYSMSYTARQAAADQCRMLQDSLQQTASTSGCPL